jgi:non-ribosomal peptide synthetase-like protein
MTTVAALTAPAEELLHPFFNRAAARWPDRIAIDVPPGTDRAERRTVTYAALARQARCLADSLQPLVTGECIVVIHLPRDTPAIFAAQLAVLQAGAAYTCIDPAFPDSQVAEILDDATAVAVLTDAAGRARLAARTTAPLFDVNALLAAPAAGRPAPAAPSWLTPAHLAYVIYTSGTTGRPKGVMIEHRSIANLVASDLPEYGLGPGDRVAQGSSVSYDSSVEEVWLALAAGATVVVLDDDTVRLGPDLVPWLQRERITVLCPPPTLLRTTGCDRPDLALPELKLVYVGGEALPADVAARWARGRRLENGYGPTECTVTSLRTRITGDNPISIGRPVRGLTAVVLSDALTAVPDGEPGELCLGGSGLARGYRGRPDLTAEKFPEHPQHGRIYRTGDLVRRGPGGDYFYLGRIDAQVKLRGYRIELEAIETRLAECPGVREAACTVQGETGRQFLAGFIVPTDPATPPGPEHLIDALRRVLPAYMVPARLQYVDALPRSPSGKLNRRQLPVLEPAAHEETADAAPPRTDAERRLEAVFRQVFNRTRPVSIHADFFDELGGDSLSAAVATSLLRESPGLASLTVRDLYEGRTIAGIAPRVRGEAPGAAGPGAAAPRARPQPGLATAVQTGWLVKDLLLGSALLYFGTFHLLPGLVDGLGLVATVLLAPLFGLAGLALFVPFSVALAVAAKRSLIGRYRPQRAPVWGGFYVRNWIVQHTVRLVPWWLIEGTEFQCMALRALGAKIGRRVHLHRGVDLLHGGWDLLEIGDDVTVSQDVTLRVVELDAGEIVVGPVTLGRGCTLEVHSGVGPGCVVGPEAYLTAWSSLAHGAMIPAGECWDGVPAAPTGRAPVPPAFTSPPQELSPAAAAAGVIAARVAVLAVLALPAEGLAVALAGVGGIDTTEALIWSREPTFAAGLLLGLAAIATLATPLTLALEALVCRGIGRVRPGVISRWSPGYVRVGLKTALVDSAGQWLYGTLFWPHWLRLAGMKIGRGCEISGLIDTVPELIEIGDRTFCADGIYLGGPRVHRGTVELGTVRLGRNTFLGNGVIIRGGQHLPDDILLGVCTTADPAKIRPGTAWFGHPPFQLPQRQVVQVDHRLTHAPAAIRVVNRVGWELLRFTLPAAPAVLVPLCYGLVDTLADRVGPLALLLIVGPAATLAFFGTLTVLALAVKWLLLGRVRPDAHALWSCWASRWDFHCMAWSFYVPTVATSLAGTLWLNALLRAAGSHVGRGVVLGGTFAQDLPDPDMLHFEDGATIECNFQAHTFEDRVLKVDRVTIRRDATVGRAAVLLYGAEIGAATRVAAHSVVMKYERLLPGKDYAGFPTRVIGDAR